MSTLQGMKNSSSSTMVAYALLSMAMVFTVLASPAVAEEECMHKNIMCYTCDSMYDPRCHDPFNFTNPPDSEECLGCCVKLVTNVGTEIEVTRRLCTKRLSINLFMVDHVCMREGDRTGHMCFCEDDNCNGAHGASSPWRLLIMFAAIFSSSLLLAAFSSNFPVH